MENVILIIILIGGAVVFLSNVFRQVKNEREQALQRTNLTPRRRDSNTERFLEEVNRRRQQAGGQPISRPPVRPVTLAPGPSPVARREPFTRKPTIKTEKPRSVRPTSRPAPARSEVLGVVPVDVPAALVMSQIAAQLPEPQSSARSATTQVVARPISPMLRQVLPFLKSRQTLRGGFVLHEILGPPKCRQQARILATLTQGHNQQNQS